MQILQAKINDNDNHNDNYRAGEELGNHESAQIYTNFRIGDHEASDRAREDSFGKAKKS